MKTHVVIALVAVSRIGSKNKQAEKGTLPVSMLCHFAFNEKDT